MYAGVYQAIIYLFTGIIFLFIIYDMPLKRRAPTKKQLAALAKGRAKRRAMLKK